MTLTESKFVITPNELRSDWPKRKDCKASRGSSAEELFEEAVAKYQHNACPYYGHPYDDNISWRQMVWIVRSLVEDVSDRTFLWKDPAPKVQGTVQVRPNIKYGARDSLGFRYAYVSWEMME